jgi:hypothetical protein
MGCMLAESPKNPPRNFVFNLPNPPNPVVCLRHSNNSHWRHPPSTRLQLSCTFTAPPPGQIKQIKVWGVTVGVSRTFARPPPLPGSRLARAVAFATRWLCANLRNPPARAFWLQPAPRRPAAPNAPCGHRRRLGPYERTRPASAFCRRWLSCFWKNQQPNQWLLNIIRV